MNSKTNKIFNYALVGVGVVSIVFAVLCFVLNTDFDYGYWVSAEVYGGDAYTGIQNAAAATANRVDGLSENVAMLAKSIRMGLGFILLLAGLLIVLYGIRKMMEEKTNEKQATVEIEE
ncbi:MAG: hypothetical protein IJB34_07920 [Clostridia bacterium]|nr:hypothetical protein [Clostridia bacterium]